MSDVMISQADLLVEEVESAALQLSREHRARIAGRLLSSLDEDPRLEQAWADELRRRIAAVDSGEMKVIPLEDTMQEIEDLLR